MFDATVSTTNDAFLYSVNKLSQALGKSRDLIMHRIARIEPVKKINGHDVYHLRDVVQLIDDNIDHTVKNPDSLAPRERKDWYEGESRRIEILKKQSQLLNADDVRETWAESLKAVMLRLDTLVDVVERDVGLDSEQIKSMQSIIDLQREQLYGDLCSLAQETS